jgi:hypothetical protein
MSVGKRIVKNSKLSKITCLGKNLHNVFYPKKHTILVMGITGTVLVFFDCLNSNKRLVLRILADILPLSTLFKVGTACCIV